MLWHSLSVLIPLYLKRIEEEFKEQVDIAKHALSLFLCHHSKHHLMNP